MKKQILLSLVAAFVLALGANAQSNTYNMKVKMADGTEITIGPNDIDNISFNEGSVVVSGTRLQEVLEKLASVHVWEIGEDGYWYVDGVKTEKFSRGADGKDGREGVAGRDGTSWEIGDDGYWYRNGMKTEHKAVRDADIQNLQTQIDELKAMLQ
ncbi:MAG: hypothetical protein IJK46_03420 [Prevotella sp.]|nr:hypothetical protein [Prevotella sp.]